MKYMAILLCLFLVGCAPALLVGAVGYTMSSSRKASAELLSAYDTYKLEMQKINVERAKLGVAEEPILSYEEWWDQRYKRTKQIAQKEEKKQ